MEHFAREFGDVCGTVSWRFLEVNLYQSNFFLGGYSLILFGYAWDIFGRFRGFGDAVGSIGYIVGRCF